jgi:hypothetical protein
VKNVKKKNNSFVLFKSFVLDMSGLSRATTNHEALV